MGESAKTGTTKTGTRQVITDGAHLILLHAAATFESPLLELRDENGVGGCMFNNADTPYAEGARNAQRFSAGIGCRHYFYFKGAQGLTTLRATPKKSAGATSPQDNCLPCFRFC